MLLVNVYHSFLCSQYHSRTVLSSNSSQNEFTLPSGFRNMKHSIKSRFLHHAVTYLLNDIPSQLVLKTAIKFLHDVTISQSTYFLASNHVFKTSSPQTSAGNCKMMNGTGKGKSCRGREAYFKPSSPCRTCLSQRGSSFCSSLLSYHERIGLIPSPLCLT